MNDTTAREHAVIAQRAREQRPELLIRVAELETAFALTGDRHDHDALVLARSQLRTLNRVIERAR